jgi:cytochrome c5
MRSVLIPAMVALALGAPALSAAPPAKLDGESVYTGVCLRCHGTGEYGAPRLGDPVAWQPRFHAGVDHLLDQAVEGLGAMPPRGGKDDLSDAELRAAIVFMLRAAGFDAE